MTPIRFIYIVFVFSFVLSSCKVKQVLPSGATPVSQISLARVDKMPFHPKPYKYRDWKKTAIEFDNYIFDFNQKGKNLPFVWLDGMKRNFPDTTFGIYTALGDIRMGAIKRERDLMLRLRKEEKVSDEVVRKLNMNWIWKRRDWSRSGKFK